MITNGNAHMFEKEALDKMQTFNTKTEVFAMSTAISTKRIADLLEGALKGEGLTELVHKLTNTPVTAYGEGLLDGIQNSIARGKDGRTTY